MRAIPRSFCCIIIASALTGAALPTLAAECKPLQRVMSLDIERLFRDPIGIRAMIGDSPEIFLVNTGAALSSVTQATVLKYQLTTKLSRRSLSGILDPDFTFMRSDREARLPSITVGYLHQANPSLMIWPPI